MTGFGGPACAFEWAQPPTRPFSSSSQVHGPPPPSSDRRLTQRPLINTSQDERHVQLPPLFPLSPASFPAGPGHHNIAPHAHDTISFPSPPHHGQNDAEDDPRMASENGWHHSPPASSSRPTSQMYAHPGVGVGAHTSQEMVSFVSPPGPTSPYGDMSRYHDMSQRIPSLPSPSTGMPQNMSPTGTGGIDTPSRMVPDGIVTRSKKRGLDLVEGSMAGQHDQTRHNGVNGVGEHRPMFLSDHHPQTPSHSPTQPHFLRTSLPSISANALQSLQSQPNPPTPASASPSFSAHSGFTFFSQSSRTASMTSNPRSASPAMTEWSEGPVTHPSGAVLFDHNDPTPHLAERQKHRKQRLTNVDRRNICVWAQEYPTDKQEDIAAKFKVERSTVSKILKKKQEWLQVKPGEETVESRRAASKFPRIEDKIIHWMTHRADQSPVTDAMLRAKAKEYAREEGIAETKFKASSGWVENFKTRKGIRRGVYRGLSRERDWGAQSIPGPRSGPRKAFDDPMHPVVDRRKRRRDFRNIERLDGDPDPDIDTDDELPPMPTGPPPLTLQEYREDMNEAGQRQEAEDQRKRLEHFNAVAELAQQHAHESMRRMIQTGEIQLPALAAPRPEDMQGVTAYDEDGRPVIYAPVPQPSGVVSAPPTLADADEALVKVITFLDLHPDVGQHGDREILRDVHREFFARLGGMTYERRER